MKLHYLLIPLGIIALAAMAVGVYQANSAPLPAGFPSARVTLSRRSTAREDAPPLPSIFCLAPKGLVKSYPAYRAATYRQQGNLAEATNQAFSPLYQHISSNQISMTAPVETRYPNSTLETAESLNTQGEAFVSFLYPSTNIYPKAIASNIESEDIPPMTVVSLVLKGGYSYRNYREGLVRLEDWLKQHPEYEIARLPRRFF